ncbi:MAG: hypothetical protein ABSG67_13120 [Thermoguttaceae bacterium]
MNIFKKTESGLYFGNVNSDLRKFVSQYYQHLPTFRYAIVLSIDSTRIPTDLISMLRHFRVEARLEAAGVVITENQLYNAIRNGFFTGGFDEILLLDKDPIDQTVPVQISLPPYLDGLIDSIPKVEAEMKATGGVLAMVDGVDLSYATWDAAFAEFIESEFGG